MGWVRTRDHVDWVPLAPRDVYYGYGNYGPNSVDIRKRDDRQTNVSNITYRNVQVNNSVTVINNNTFVTGRREVVIVRENPFLAEKINIGRPDIKPERASFAPVVKTIEPAKLPPQQVNRIAVKELKQERRLVKEQNKSVINKGEPVKALAVKAVEQPKSPAERVQERKQARLEKGKSGAVLEGRAVKAEEKSASPTEPPEIKETKGRKQSSPEQAVKQPENARDKAQERKQTQMEKSKSGAPVESLGVKAEERDQKRVKREDSKKQEVPDSKTESNVERKDTKTVEAKEKSAGSIKTHETIERKGGRQLGPDETEKSAPGPAKVSDSTGERKSGKQTVLDQKESDESTISWTEGDRHGEFALDSSDRADRGLGGSAAHERTNLIVGALV